MNVIDAVSMASLSPIQHLHLFYYFATFFILVIIQLFSLCIVLSFHLYPHAIILCP